MKIHAAFLPIALAVAFAVPQPRLLAVDWRFPVGITYASGLTEVLDAMDDNHRFDDKFSWPVGLSFHPYAELDFGLGIGASIGPVSLFFIDTGFDTSVSYIIPLGFDARYTFLRDTNVSPYARAGFRYNVAGGDYLSRGDPGFLAAVGVEFFRRKAVALGLEFAYDSSTVEVDPGRFGGRKRVKPSEFMVGVYAVF
jgi:hypothetical protein